MTDVDHYIRAATRDNTRLSYRAAVEHFESQWGGFLPATADSVARYLVDYANNLSVNTLRQRLAGLAAWHLDQGFPDPTKAPHVKKVLKGIAELHPVVQKQARPIQLDRLTHLVNSFDRFIKNGSSKEALQSIRDKALLLIGFWRAFRSDGLARLCVEHIQAESGKGVEIFVPCNKGDHSRLGRHYKAPALQQLCPVEAYLHWVSTAQLKSGPVFRSINRRGQLSEDALHPASIIGIIKQCCTRADIDEENLFSSHSLRRGFAAWANAQSWDTKYLMGYVGWKDVQSAMRYIDAPDPFSQYRNDNGIAKPSLQIERDKRQPIQSLLQVLLVLEPYSKLSKRIERAKKLIERHCLSPWSMNKADPEGRKYEIAVEHTDGETLDEILDELLWDNQRVSGTIEGNFYLSTQHAGLTETEAATVTRIFQDKLDFARAIRKGDKFQIIRSAQYIEDQPTGQTRIESARIQQRTNEYTAFLFEDGRYYDKQGNSLARAFTRTPLAKSYRISSPFNPRRVHPVTGRVGPHNGTDFATPTGTRVLSTGDGVVARVGNHPFAGRYIDIQHGGQYKTRYLHLHRVLVRRGESVSRGQAIALSGNSGRSTGPHLHFELHIHGRPVNPMKAKIPITRSISQKDKHVFAKQVTE